MLLQPLISLIPVTTTTYNTGNNTLRTKKCLNGKIERA